jgi:hypothetical protein
MSNTCLTAATSDKLVQLRAFGFTYTSSNCANIADAAKQLLITRRTRFVNTIYPLLSGSLPKKYKLIYLKAYSSFSTLSRLTISSL